MLSVCSLLSPEMVGTVVLLDSCITARESPELQPECLHWMQFRLQAADFLALERHVQEVSQVLAARLFAAGLRCHKAGDQGDPKEVLFYVFATRYVCLHHLIILFSDKVYYFVQQVQLFSI
jgi:hypothetical protein